MGRREQSRKRTAERAGRGVRLGGVATAAFMTAAVLTFSLDDAPEWMLNVLGTVTLVAGVWGAVVSMEARKQAEGDARRRATVGLWLAAAPFVATAVLYAGLVVYAVVFALS